MDSQTAANKSRSSVSWSTQPRPHWSSKFFYFVLISGVTLSIDQLTKFLAPGFGLPIQLNAGVSFGAFSGVSVLLLIGLLVLVLHWFYTLLPPGILGLLAGSASSNLVDRILFGGVRDWMSLDLGPIHLNNNLADWMLCAAVLAAVVQFAHGERQKHATQPS